MRRRFLQSLLGELRGKTVAVLGLTYKPGTDTLRRSSAVEFCEWLSAEGAQVRAFDPAIKTLPSDLSASDLPGSKLSGSKLSGKITLCCSWHEAVRKAEAVVVATEWPEFREVTSTDLVREGRPNSARAGRVGISRQNARPSRVIAVSVRREGRMNLTGQRCLITGANQGFGLAIAKAYAGAGADVCLCAQSGKLDAARAAVRTEAPGRVLSQTADIADAAQLDKVVRLMIEEWGGVDVAVCNAGIYGPKGRIEEVNWEEWAEAITINLLGTVLTQVGP